MIDQSNRAGKFYVNGNDKINENNTLRITPMVSSRTMTKRYNKCQEKSRDLLLNERKLHRRANPVKSPIVSQQLSPSYLMKGKSVYCSNMIFNLMLPSIFINLYHV